MATQPIQKITIARKDIEAISTSGNYFLKYRIVADGGSKTSAWSPVYALNLGNVWGTGTYSASGTVLVQNNSNAGYIDISWQLLEGLQIAAYDIYIASGTAGSLTGYYSYAGTTSNTSITIAKPAGANRLKAAIFAKGTSQLDYSTIANVSGFSFTTNTPPSFLAESIVTTI